MNKNERIRAAINGEEVDKIPYAFWMHLPEVDLDAVLLARKTFEFYKRYDLDFVKTMNNGMYAVEDFDCVCDFSEIKKGGVGKIIKSPINTIEDWAKIRPRSIYKGALARELLSLELLLKNIKDRAPVVFTVFSPLTIANKLSKNLLLEHIKYESKNLIHKALSAITETTVNLVDRVMELGASGVFFASQLSSLNFLTEDQYREYGVPYDLKVLQATSVGWFNVLHIHGNNIMFNLLKDYPIQAINWHIWETDPDLKSARKITNKCLVGGIVRNEITEKNEKAVYEQIYKSLEQSKGYKYILTPGCVIRYPINREMLLYIREAKYKIEKNLFNSSNQKLNQF